MKACKRRLFTTNTFTHSNPDQKTIRLGRLNISITEQTTFESFNKSYSDSQVQFKTGETGKIALESCGEENFKIRLINNSKNDCPDNQVRIAYTESKNVSILDIDKTKNVENDSMSEIEKDIFVRLEQITSINLTSTPVKSVRYQIKSPNNQMNNTVLSCIPNLDIRDCLLSLPTNHKIVDTKVVFTICQLDKPIGITMMSNDTLVIGERGDKNTLNVFDSTTGMLINVLQSKKKFYRPSDMTTLADGRLVVRDDRGLHLFDENGNYMKPIASKGVYGRCYGVASDGSGKILTINTNPRGFRNCITREGETDILTIDLETDCIVEKIELADIVTDKTHSACRFLHCDGKKIYVVDLGLDTIYVLSIGTSTAKVFGQSGKLLGQLQDPAGIAIDSVGNMIIADACNNRIQIFDKHRNYIGLIKISIPLQRPSGIYLDIETKSLYVLSLKGNNSVIKLSLIDQNKCT
jgi:hypothetical protein